jgi:hypothetical protein
LATLTGCGHVLIVATTNFTDLVTLPAIGPVPVNVARICQWSWMCARAPQGPNVHGRPEGYWVMAGAFVAALVQPSLW